jgi:hypothetical protein
MGIDASKSLNYNQNLGEKISGYFKKQGQKFIRM